MQCISKTKTHHLVRLDIGEEFIGALQTYAMQEGIDAATFTALGAIDDVTLAFFDAHTKAYETQRFEEELEIASITGNIGTKQGAIIVHAHGVFGRRDMSALDGHIKEMKISVTCEVALHILPGPAERKHDEQTGLFLLS